ncbi:MAG: adenosine kinase [Desulfatibacillaceae bacterium]
MFNDRKLIVGVGSALMDILAQEDDAFLESTGAAKGGMTLVENGFIDDLMGRFSQKPSIVSGGSACNTVVGVGKLGGRARFVGKCGTDEFGRMFRQGLLDNGIEPTLFESRTPTGRVISIITPDAQRSMFTHLGASAETSPADITAEVFSDAAVVHVEGYILFNRDLMLATLESAKKAGAKVSLDLASYTVVQESRDFLMSLLDRVDILIANEDEAQAFTGHSDDAKAISALAEHAEVAVLKVGPRGSYIATEGKIARVEAQYGNPALDTTGAGDLWAAGFLYGLVNGLPVDKAGELGSACGYEVCQVVGACIPDTGWHNIRRILG